jgi:hypothetical protein
MKMKRNLIHTLTVIACFTGNLMAGVDDKKADAPKGAKPAASPGWIIIEDTFWYPWRYEPLTWFENAEKNFRQKEEKGRSNRDYRFGDRITHFASVDQIRFVFA